MTRSILNHLKNNPHLRIVSDYFRNRPQDIYLVGGYPRDLFLNKKKDSADLDFAVSANAISVSRMLSKKLKSPFVVLDKGHGSSRIIYQKEGSSCNLDFTDFRGKDINEDILHRDFTVNSLAVDLKRLRDGAALKDVLLDEYGAVLDIKSGIIRMISEFSFREDPLRIMRAFSLMAAFSFRIEAKTVKAISKYNKEITSSAFERISEELFKILNSDNTFEVIKSMERHKTLDALIPEIKNMRKVNQGPYHHLDVYNHCLETLRQTEVLLLELRLNKDIQGYLNQAISGTHTRKGLLKFAAFLHDIGKPLAKERLKGKICFYGHERAGRNIVRGIVERLRLSNNDRSALDKMIFWHLRPGYMADIDPLSERAVYKFFRDTQEEAVSVLLLSIADQRSTRGPLTRGSNRGHHEEMCLGLAKRFFKKKKEKKLPKLLDGNQVMRRLKLSPGPVIGKILDEINEAQGAGEIRTKAQALALLDKFTAEKKVLK